MSWETLKGLEKSDIGPVEMYVNKQYIGPTEGSTVLEFPETTLPVKYGIPALQIGNIITEVMGTLTMSCIYATPEHFKLLGGVIASDDNGDYMTFAAEILKPSIENVVLHHYNKLSKKHLIIGLWRVQSTAPIRWEFVSANPSKVMTVDLNFSILATEEQEWAEVSPLGVAYWCDTFDINNLPWEGGGPGPGPEPPGPGDEHTIESETISISNHAGNFAHGKISNYTLRDAENPENTLFEGSDYTINTNTGEFELRQASSYYNAGSVVASYTWWDNRTEVTNEEVTCTAGVDNFFYRLAHNPIENASTLAVTDSTGVTDFTLGVDYSPNYNTGELFALEGAMAAENYEIKASYYYYSNNE